MPFKTPLVLIWFIPAFFICDSSNQKLRIVDRWCTGLRRSRALIACRALPQTAEQPEHRAPHRPDHTNRGTTCRGPAAHPDGARSGCRSCRQALRCVSTLGHTQACVRHVLRFLHARLSCSLPAMDLRHQTVLILLFPDTQQQNGLLRMVVSRP